MAGRTFQYRFALMAEAQSPILYLDSCQEFEMSGRTLPENLRT